MPARHAILGLLMQQPMHGYDIDGQFEEGLRHICHVNISQIYAYLKNMEERDWLESETIYQSTNPPKKVFHVTDKGREEMQRWLSEPVDSNRQMRDELLTKIFFMWRIAPDQLPALIETQLEIYRKWRDEHLERRANATGFLQHVLAEAGSRHAETDYEWLLWVREQVQAKLSQSPGDARTTSG